MSSELIVARKGFGYLIGFLGANGSYDAMFAVVLTVAFLGFAADRGLSAAHEPDAAMARIDAAMPTRRRTAAGDGRASLARTLLWGFARVFSIARAAGRPGKALARSGAFTPFLLPALSAVLERIWTDAVAGDLCHQHRR